MNRRTDPSHDRVRLSAHESSAWASLERTLFDDDEKEGDRASHPVRRRFALTGARRALGRIVARVLGALRTRPRLARLAPWVALGALLLMPVAITATEHLGFVCALLATAALSVWLVTSLPRWGARFATLLKTWGEPRNPRSPSGR